MKILKHYSPRLLAIMFMVLALTLLIGSIAKSYTGSVPVTLSVPSASLEVSGYASPGALITIYDGSIPMATTTANASGEFIKLIPTLTVGLHSISVSQKDSKGVESISINKLINIAPQQTTIVDFIIPPTISLSTNRLTAGGNVNVSGYSLPSSQVFLYLDNQLNIYRTINTDSNGYYIDTISTNGFSPGSHNFKLKYLSSLGYSEFSKAAIFTVDEASTPSTPDKQPEINIGSKPKAITKPTITNPPTNTKIDGDKITISGQALPNSQIIINVNDVATGSVFSDSTGMWYFEFYPTEAKNIITVVSCQNNNCSEPSDPIELFFNVKGALACGNVFILKDYRFETKEGKSISLNAEFNEQKPYTLVIDWGDGTTEKFSVNSDIDNAVYKHVYDTFGQYNGQVIVSDESGDCTTNKFFSVAVSQNTKLDFYYILIFVLFGVLGLLLIISLALRIKKQLA